MLALTLVPTKHGPACRSRHREDERGRVVRGPSGRRNVMEILIAALVLAVGLVAAAALFTRRSPGLAPSGTAAPARVAPPAPAAVAVRAPAGPTTTEDGKHAERGVDLLRLEERLRAREEAVESRLSELGDRERKLVLAAPAPDRARQHHIRTPEH